MQIWSAEIKELETLYTSIKGQFPDLEKEVEKLVKADDENMVLLYSRRCLEVIITDLCECELNRTRKTEPLKGIIDKLNREEKVPAHIITSMDHLNSLSTFGAHPKEFDPEQVRPVLINLTTIIKWYLKYKNSQIESKPIIEEEKYGSKGAEASKEETRKPKKRLIITLSGFLLGCIMIIVVLAVFNIVGKRKHSADLTKLEKSIAVLPFKNLSGDAGQDYFIEGMHEELITDLAKIKSLKVISRTSVLRYKNTEKSIPEIARELDVNILIEGSVLFVGDQVRVNSQMILGSTDQHLWAERYDHKLDDVFGLINEVARTIADEINIVLTPQEKEHLKIIYPVNPAAQEYYLQGLYYYNKMSVDPTRKAIEYFQKAIEADTNFAKAYVGLADSYSVLAFFGAMPVQEATSKIMHLFDQAFRLDNHLAEAHQSLGAWKCYWEWDWQGADKEFKYALDLNPSLVGNNEYAWYLAAMRRFDDAIAEAQRALRLDPFTLLSNLTLAYLYSVAGRHNESIEQYQRILELGLNDTTAYDGLSTAYRRMGNYDEAVKAYQKLMALRDSTPERIESLGQAYQESGPRGFWLWHLEQIKSHYDERPLWTVIIYAQLGEKEEALDYLEMAYQKRANYLYMLNADPDFEPIRNEPRFQDILKQMNFHE